MLCWIMRWGVPLALVAVCLVCVDSPGTSAASYMHGLLDNLRDAIMGMIPRFF